MSGLLTRPLREITALAESLGRRVLTDMALLIAGLIFLLASFAFLSVALYLWLAQMTRPAIAALAVAGLHVAIAGTCLIAFRLKGPKRPSKTNPATREETARAEFAESIEHTLAPIIALLHQADMKPEEVALRLGAALTKEVGPLALVGLALAAGFLFGRRLTAPKKE